MRVKLNLKLIGERYQNSETLSLYTKRQDNYFINFVIVINVIF